MNIFARAVAVLMLFSVTVMSVSCQQAVEPKNRVFLEYFDTVSTFTDYGNMDDGSFSSLCDEVKAWLEGYDSLFDIYNPTSDLAKLNAAGGEPVEVDAETYLLLSRAKSYYELTDGAVNIAFGAVISLWHDAGETANKNPAAAYLPSAAELAEAEKHCDIAKLILGENNTVTLADPAMRLDAGAFVKGFVCDRISEKLTERGITNVGIDLGGNICILGKKADGNAVLAGVASPFSDSADYLATLYLTDASLVTSGGSERYFEYEGKRYHHIISPDTLFPAERFTQVTVYSKDASLADALSTALFILPYEEGKQLVASLPDTEAMWVYADKSVRFSDGFPKKNR